MAGLEGEGVMDEKMRGIIVKSATGKRYLFTTGMTPIDIMLEQPEPPAKDRGPSWTDISVQDIETGEYLVGGPLNTVFNVSPPTFKRGKPGTLIDADLLIDLDDESE